MLSIGECMVELMQAEGGLLRKGYAGDTFNAAYYARLFLPSDWSVAYCSAVGTDTVSDEMLAFMAEKRHRHGGRPQDRRSHAGPLHDPSEGRRAQLLLLALGFRRQDFSPTTPTSLRRAIEGADLILFSGITLAILAPEAVETLLAELRRAKAAGKRVVFDPNIRPRLWDDAERMRQTTDGWRPCRQPGDAELRRRGHAFRRRLDQGDDRALQGARRRRRGRQGRGKGCDAGVRGIRSRATSRQRRSSAWSTPPAPATASTAPSSRVSSAGDTTERGRSLCRPHRCRRHRPSRRAGRQEQARRLRHRRSRPPLADFGHDSIPCASKSTRGAAKTQTLPPMAQRFLRLFSKGFSDAR